MIEKKEIEELGALARIKLTDKEIEGFQKEFGDILSYISELSVIARKEKEPKAGTVYNVLREDENPHESGVYTDDLLQEMPQSENGYLKVKKIL